MCYKIFAVLLGLGISLGVFTVWEPIHVKAASAQTAENEVENNEVEDNEAGDVVWLSFSQPWTLDPQMANDVINRDITSQIFEGLMWYAPCNTLKPLLAESYTISEDNLTYTFNLRRGVTFHDGMPFTAIGVKMSFERMFNPQIGLTHFLSEIIDEIIIVDNYTIQFVLNAPFPAFLAHLTHPSGFIISPAAMLEEVYGGRTIEENPVGTGPFVFAYQILRDYTRITPNPKHWRSTPAHDVVFRVIPNHDLQMAAINGGLAHAFISTSPQIHEHYFIPQADLRSVPTANISYVGFNTGQDWPFNDPRVRRAASMAINKTDIFYNVQRGRGILATGPLRDGLVTHAPTDVQELPFNPEAARELLAEAGFPDGFSTTIWTNEGNITRLHIAESVQADLAVIGIEVEIILVDWVTYIEAMTLGLHDMFVFGWTASMTDANEWITPLFHSDELSDAFWSNNRTFYSNPVVDKLIERARLSSDFEYRDEIYREIVEILIYDAPMVFLFHPDALAVTRGIEGMKFNFRLTPFFYDVRLKPGAGVITTAQSLDRGWETDIRFVPSHHFPPYLSVMSFADLSERIIETAYEELHILIYVRTVSASEIDLWLNLMVAAGDMTDLSMGIDKEFVHELISWGVIADMKPYLMAYAHELPYLMDFFGDSIWDNVNPETGGIYYIVISDRAYTTMDIYFFVSSMNHDFRQVMMDALRYLDLLARPENRLYFAIGVE